MSRFTFPKTSQIFSLLVAMMLAATATAPALAADAQAATDGYVDVHCHLVPMGMNGGGGLFGGGGGGGSKGGLGPAGKMQKGRRGSSQGSKPDYAPGMANLLDHMNRYGVSKAVIMPPPRVYGNVMKAETKMLAGYAKKYKGRIYYAAGGDTLNPMIQANPPEKVTTAIKKEFKEMAEELAREPIACFGEMTAMHLSFQRKHPYEETPPDHPLFLILADVAAKHGLPIDLHMEAVPEDMPAPQGFKRRNPDTPDVIKANIPAFERLLRYNREARVVWQHIGWDNTGHMTIPLLRRLLQAHPNLFMALRLEKRGMTVAGTPMPNRLVDRSWRVKSEWVDLFNQFPDRFVIGTDEFMGPAALPGQDRSPQSFEETWGLVNQLPEHLARRIGRDNALRIYRFE